MSLKFEILDEKEITKFAKNPSGFERLLPKLTTDEISLLLEKIDELVTFTYTKKLYVNLMRLKIMILEEESFRERFEIS